MRSVGEHPDRVAVVKERVTGTWPTLHEMVKEDPTGTGIWAET